MVDKFKYERTKKGVCDRIYWSQVQSSKQREYDLPSYSREELRDFILTNPMFDVLYDEWVKSDYDRWKKPSIDRINDYKPYTLDNIQLMTWKENNEKAHLDMKNGINNKQNKIVYQYGSKGNFIKEHYSINQASREIINTTPIDIIRSCKGDRISCGGFIWSFNRLDKIELGSIVEKYNQKNTSPKNILQIKDGEIVGTYESIQIASEITKIGRRAINNCLKGWSNSSGGFNWEYNKNI